MYTKFERLLSKSLTTLEVMTYYLVVHTGPGHTPESATLNAVFGVCMDAEKAVVVFGCREESDLL